MVHHRFPILEVGVRRVVALDHAGFALYGPGVSGQQGESVWLLAVWRDPVFVCVLTLPLIE